MSKDFMFGVLSGRAEVVKELSDKMRSVKAVDSRLLLDWLTEIHKGNYAKLDSIKAAQMEEVSRGTES